MLFQQVTAPILVMGLILVPPAQAGALAEACATTGVPLYFHSFLLTDTTARRFMGYHLTQEPF
jgi:hypothetical protein